MEYVVGGVGGIGVTFVSSSAEFISASKAGQREFIEDSAVSL